MSAAETLLNQLIDNGQIATQYVDLTGQPTMDLRYNPNGSVMAIEGITSPDGRVLRQDGPQRTLRRTPVQERHRRQVPAYL